MEERRHDQVLLGRFEGFATMEIVHVEHVGSEMLIVVEVMVHSGSAMPVSYKRAL